MLFFCFLDPRVQDWPLMSSPLPTMAICLFYAYFSKVLGPRIMANRKPMNLRNILVVYNFIQTIFSAWIFYEVSLLQKETINHSLTYLFVNSFISCEFTSLCSFVNKLKYLITCVRK